MPRTKIVLLLLVVGVTATSQAQAPASGPKPEPKAETWSDPSPHKSGFVTVNGVRLHYLDWGGSGETLMFLAGLGNNAHIFDDFAPSFTTRFHVLGMTRRGLELSDKPESGYDVESRGADILALLDALQTKRVILVGHSIAGDELTAFAAAHPDRVDKLIYLDAANDRSHQAEAAREGKEPAGAPLSQRRNSLRWGRSYSSKFRFVGPGRC